MHGVLVHSALTIKNGTSANVVANVVGYGAMNTMTPRRTRASREDSHVYEYARAVLADLMREYGTTQTELGKILGEAQRTISDRLHGRSRLTLADIYKLAIYFQKAPEEFFPGPFILEDSSAWTRIRHALTWSNLAWAS